MLSVLAQLKRITKGGVCGFYLTKNGLLAPFGLHFARF